MEALIFVIFVWYAINVHRKLKILEEIKEELFRLNRLKR